MSFLLAADEGPHARHGELHVAVHRATMVPFSISLARWLVKELGPSPDVRSGRLSQWDLRSPGSSRAGSSARRAWRAASPHVRAEREGASPLRGQYLMSSIGRKSSIAAQEAQGGNAQSCSAGWSGSSSGSKVESSFRKPKRTPSFPVGRVVPRESSPVA